MTKTTKKTSKRARLLERTIKYLSSNQHPQIAKLIHSKAHNDFIKSISNAALNAYKGGVKLPARARTRFRKHRKVFESLINRKVALAKNVISS